MSGTPDEGEAPIYSAAVAGAKEHVVVLTGGELRGVSSVDVPPAPYVIAADSGLAWASALGLEPDLIVGDMDSVDPDALADFEEQGGRTEVRRFESAKDFSDFELAMEAALQREPATITVIGLLGGRFDHVLGNVAVLAKPELRRAEVVALTATERIAVVHDHVELAGRPGDLVSLLPFGGDAHGVRTAGLRYALKDETLFCSRSRGIDNEFVQEGATVSLTDGVLLAIQQISPRPHVATVL